ncbi:motile sperm domain-containing protein 3, partial [Tachyglossus aculeatus]|uniref:motile sperm domain-containing protein 3 n=1 Tax=Tachyglossus aculeatus TaxID=9261 RepID=UPI0018F58A22
SRSRSRSPSRSPSVPTPVLVFPAELVFAAADRRSHKQVLTLYNTSCQRLRFRVLSTAPSRYTVLDAEGHVRPQSCIDIVIRIRAPDPAHYGASDCFRIELREEGAAGRVVGHKDVPSVLQPPPPGPRGPQIPPARALPPDAPLRSRTLRSRSGRQGPLLSLAPRVFLLYLLTGLTCVAFLLLPLQGDAHPALPRALHVSLGQKLVAAYVLGLLTMAFLQP